MAITAQFLRNIMAEARPIIERQMDDAKLIAGFRDVVSANGGDWGALKALIKAHVEDENDEAGDGKRVQKIRDKADSTSAYADMLGLANMNENNFSAGSSSGRIAEFDSADAGSNPAPVTIDPETGEITDQEQPETANEVPAQDGGGTATGEGPSDKSNAAHPVSEQELADADLNDGTAAGQTAIEVVTGGESAAIISPSAAPPAEAVAVAPQPSHAATAAIPEGIPAFLLKERKPLRPNCLHPDNCAGYGSHTCHSCTQAMAESEAA